MPRLEWDKSGERLYETGVKNGVLFKKSGGSYGVGVAWNGLTKVSEKPEGAEVTTIYADDIEYLNLISREKFNGSIGAYTYPDEWAECDGSAMAGAVKVHQQPRKPFGLAYVTTIGNDEEGTDFGYIIHLVYNALATPSEVERDTINDTPEAKEFSWEFKTTPENVTGRKPTSHLEIYSKVKTANGYVDVDLRTLEACIYGADEFSATATYAAGDIVTHTESSTTKLYKANAAISTAGAWDATKWTEITGSGNGIPFLPTPDQVIAMVPTPVAG